jgi:hypothetical protein
LPPIDGQPRLVDPDRGRSGKNITTGNNRANQNDNNNAYSKASNKSQDGDPTGNAKRFAKASGLNRPFCGRSRQKQQASRVLQATAKGTCPQGSEPAL